MNEQEANIWCYIHTGLSLDDVISKIDERWTKIKHSIPLHLDGYFLISVIKDDMKLDIKIRCKEDVLNVFVSDETVRRFIKLKAFL